MACVQWLLLEPRVIQVEGAPDPLSPALTRTPLPFCFHFGLIWVGFGSGFGEVLPKISFEKKKFFLEKWI